ncbi:ABC-2 type transport system permease protein [Nocardioides sp. BE266]|uniref:ABC transporter permease n=1 Tax=Nocardioides sp. BE266 TaxID=2817725 RepID=UPI0028661906|nr:ABC transporter permease [Nocardioides sp. BE266]MDR7254064.1 ABC-2 type transport system permease protein [Nocardioides sp. BE266]
MPTATEARAEARTEAGTDAAGTTGLLRLNLRRDRILLPVWIWLLTAMVAASAFATTGLYTDAAERVAASRVINTSPALVALYGPILNEHSAAELAMSKMTVMYALFVMGLGLVVVRRHTRVEEESGRAELMGATLVGRSAPLRAALLEAAAAAVVLGVLCMVVDVAAGLEVAGSVAFGLSWTGAALVGAGTGAVCAQLAASARTCGGLALATFAVWDVIRAAGDIGPDALGWLSPLGWGTRLDAWGDTRWWVLGLYAALAAVLVVAAHVLRGRRDLGNGLLAEGAGPADGQIGSTLALVWRLNRLSTAWWLVASLVSGALFGSVAPHIGSLFDSPAGKAALEALGGKGRVEDAMLAALLAVMAAILSAYAVQVTVSGAREETDGRTPEVLAATGSRAQVFGAQVLVAGAGLAALAVAYGAGSAIGYGSQVGGVGDALGRLVPAALAHVPAMWVVAAVAVLAWAWSPHQPWIGWAALVAFVTLGEVGPLLELPDWVIGLSPFQHVVAVPVQPVDVSSEVGLVVAATLLLAVAFGRYRARDIG